MTFIKYHTTDTQGLEQIRPLWIKLNEMHHHLATTFKDIYENMTFEDRKEYFHRIASTGTLRIDIAFDSESEQPVGYCISSLSPKKTGEIESVFVEEKYRSKNIGSTLIIRALSWLEESGCVEKMVSVANGNETAFSFYKKFGFYPRKTILEQKKER